MRKEFILILLFCLLLCVGCNKKIESKSDNDQDIQIKENSNLDEKDSEKDSEEDNKDNNSLVKPVVDNNKTEKESNSNKEESNNKNEGNSSLSQDKEEEKSEEVSNNEKIVDSTKVYTCDKMFDYELKGTKCILTRTISGIEDSQNPYTCPSGQKYKNGKCYRVEEPNIITYCDNPLAKLEGDFCVEGGTYKVYTGSSYGRGNFRGNYRIINEEPYFAYANINCPDGYEKINDPTTKKSYCGNSNGSVVSPLKATCSKSDEKLMNDNGYYCTGTFYEFFYCNSGDRLVGETCTIGVPASYGMYCDDHIKIENGKCEYATVSVPIINYSCPSGQKKASDTEALCSYDIVTDAIVSYKCPTGYTLTSDYKCKSNK